MKKEQMIDKLISGLFSKIDALEENRKSTEWKILELQNQLSCGAKTGHHFTVQGKYEFTSRFRCIKCDLKYEKSNRDLNEKEAELVNIVLKGKK